MHIPTNTNCVNHYNSQNCNCTASKQTAITLLHNYTASAAQHVARNYFVTDSQAREWDQAVTRSWSMILNKDLPCTPLMALPRKMGGNVATDMEARHTIALLKSELRDVRATQETAEEL